MVGRRRKVLKKHWLKRPEAVPKKRNLYQNRNDSKSHICDSFFENIISDMQLFNICPHVPVDIIRVSKPTKTSEKDHSFYNKASLQSFAWRETEKFL